MRRPGVLGDHLVHQFVGVQAPLHHGLDLAAAGQRHRVAAAAVLCSQATSSYGERSIRPPCRGRPDLRLGTDQDRDDQAGLGRVDGAQQRVPVDRMHDRRADRLQPLRSGSISCRKRAPGS